MKTIIYVLAMLMLCSCYKKTTMRGRIVNPVTGEGISGIQIYVTKPKKCLGYDGCGSKTIFKTESNQDGYFTIEKWFLKSKTYTVSYGYSKDKYTFINQVSATGATYNKTYYEYYLIPNGELIENINNISCFDSGDILTLNYFHRTLPNRYEGFNPVIHSGCFSYFGDSNTVPMGWYVCIGTVTKNNITTPVSDSIYVTEGGNHTWNIDY